MNEPWYVKAALTLLKPFIHEKMWKRVSCHLSLHKPFFKHLVNQDFLTFLSSLLACRNDNQDRLPALNRVKLGAKAKPVIRGRGSSQFWRAKRERLGRRLYRVFLEKSLNCPKETPEN